MIISMAWTTGAFLADKKSVTRRFWTPKYAAKFHAGDIVDAYDKSPRNGGKKIGLIRLTKDPYPQKLSDMPDDHFEREGGVMYWRDKDEFIVFMGGPERTPWVVEFEKMPEVTPWPMTSNSSSAVVGDINANRFRRHLRAPGAVHREHRCR